VGNQKSADDAIRGDGPQVRHAVAVEIGRLQSGQSDALSQSGEIRYWVYDSVPVASPLS
jgi:hypothetical protein